MSAPPVWPITVLLAVMALVMVSTGCTGWPVQKDMPATTPVQIHSGQSKILIENFTFSPSPFLVQAGAPITIINHDTAVHSVMADPGDPEPFVTAPLSYGMSHTIVLTKPGTYTYHCEEHPSMNGTIVIVP